MKTRKWVSLILTLAMLFTMQLSVYAEEVPETEITEEANVQEEPAEKETELDIETEDAENTEKVSAAEEVQEAGSGEIMKDLAGERSDSVEYRSHIQTYGWEKNYVENGALSGTTGKAKRLEAIEIKLKDQSYEGGIRYRTHIQTYGWEENYAENGAMSGTSRQAKRLEAIQIELTGEMADHYDIYYRVHAQTFDWMGWAKNGESAGTAGYGKRLEAIEIRLVEKGAAAPGETTNSYRHPLIQYRTHVQSYGWQGWKQDGAMSGTAGQAKRLEGINISLNNQDYPGGVRYRTHVQTYGWEKDYAENGAMSGTTGQAKRLEAIQIELTGEMAEHYDIYYRVHAQSFDWMGWAKNGESAGSSGFGKRLEGIEIRLVEKGGAAPESTDTPYREYDPELVAKAVNEASDFVAGRMFHKKETQMMIEFTPSGQLIAHGYYGSAPKTDKYTTYSFRAEYRWHKDEWQYLVFVKIDGVEYYFRYFNNGEIDLAGNGEFDGWYEPMAVG